MYPRKLIAVSTLLVGGHCFGATPVAAITSSGSLLVNGISVPASRVSWPVSVNDVIVTQNGSARLRFADGSTVTLQRNSRARIESASSRVEVKMLEGSAIYDVKKGSSLAINAPVLSNAPAAQAIAQGAPRQAAAPVEYRMVAQSSSTGSTSGVVVAPKAISSGAFFAAGNRNAVTSPGTGSKIVLPNGTIMEVTTNANGSYTVTKINIPVTNPNGGAPIYITPDTPSPLVGATVTLGSTTNEANMSVTLPGATAPLTPDQLGNEVYATVTIAFVQTQTQLPAGAKPPSPSPVSAGVFAPASVVSPPGS